MKRIRLTSYDLTEKPDWVPCQIVEVTKENEKRAKAVLKNRGAFVLDDPEPSTEAESDDSDDDESPSLELALTDSVDRLTEFTIDGRYVAAFRNAGHETIADVVAIEDLASVSGISPKAAEQIQEVLNDEIGDETED